MPIFDYYLFVLQFIVFSKLFTICTITGLIRLNKYR